MNRRKFIRNISILSAGLSLPSVFAKVKEAPREGYSKPDLSSWNNDSINTLWIGHSTMLINLYGKTILTDPVLFEYVGVYLLGMTFGPRRYSAPALEFEDVPKPDLVLLSHAHMDHMDYKSLAALTDKFPGEIECLTAFNTMDVIENLEWKSIRELDWGEEIELCGITIKAQEVKHFGWRYPWERDRSRGYKENGRSFNAYYLKRNGKTILFGGDTAYTDLFQKSGESVDIAIMPIGAYYPWRMNHCTPEEALQMANDVEAKVFIPIHFKTFRQGMEPPDEPMKLLTDNLHKYEMNLGVRDIGEVYSLS